MCGGIGGAGDRVCTLGNYLVVKNDQRGKRTAHTAFDVLCSQLYRPKYVGVCNGKDLGFQNILRLDQQ